jgi:hypothetical protein
VGQPNPPIHLPTPITPDHSINLNSITAPGIEAKG